MAQKPNTSVKDSMLKSYSYRRQVFSGDVRYIYEMRNAANSIIFIQISEN